MAVQNRIAPKQPETQENAVVYQANGMEVKLTPNLVRNYMVSGNKEAVTFQEVAMFMNLCKFSGLNPWLKEAYCIKYGSEPATLVVGKEAFQKRAESHPAYDGAEAGIIVINPESGEIAYRKGTVRLPGEELIGGYAEVWRKDRTHSTRIEVSFDEYAGRKKDGSLNGQWSKKPATMIRKVALVQALRETFPATFGGMYTAEEQGEIEVENTLVQEVSEEPQAEQPEIVEVEEVEVVEPPEAEGSVQQALFGGTK